MAATPNLEDPTVECFLETCAELDVGIELASGRPWIAINQQVGHGAVQVLFALTVQQYVAELTGVDTNPNLRSDFWWGKHDELMLAQPGRRRYPENFAYAPSLAAHSAARGELWWYINALCEPTDSPNVVSANRWSAGTAVLAWDGACLASITLSLTGANAYPRPAALIAGIDAGSSRAAVRELLGGTDGDTFQLGDASAHFEFIDEALVAMKFERTGVDTGAGSRA